MRPYKFSQFEQSPKASQFRNLRGSQLYEPARQHAFESPRQRHEYMTTPSYSAHDLEGDIYAEDPRLQAERLARRDIYPTHARIRSQNIDFAGSLANLSRHRANEEEQLRESRQQLFAFDKDCMKKDNNRNIEINLNFEKGKIKVDNLQGLLQSKTSEYDKIIRSYEKERMKWDTDRKISKAQLNHQQSEIQKLHDVIQTLRGKIHEQQEATGELLSYNEKQRRLSSGSVGEHQDLRTVRSLTKLNTARGSATARGSLADSDQRTQLRDIEQKTRLLKEMQRQERMTAEELMAIVHKLREQNNNYRRMHSRVTSHIIKTSEVQTEISNDSRIRKSDGFDDTDNINRSEAKSSQPKEKLQLTIIKEQNERLLKDTERLSNEANSLLSENTRILKENARLKNEITELRSLEKTQVEKLKVDISNLADMLVEKEMENDRLSEYKTRVNELVRVNEQLNQSIRDMEMQRLPREDQTSSVIDQLKNQIDGLLKEIAMLQSQKMQLMRDVRQVNEQNTNLKQMQDEIQVNYEDMERKVKEVHLKLEMATLQLDDFKGQAQQYKEMNDLLNQQLMDKSRALERSKIDTESKNSREYLQSRQKVWELSEQICRLEKQLRMVGSELQLSNSLSLELKLVNETLQQQISSQQKDQTIKRRQSRQQSSNDEIERMKEQISRIQKEHKTEVTNKTDRIQFLEEDLNKSNNKLDQFQFEREKINIDVREMEEQLEKTRIQLAKIKQNAKEKTKVSKQTIIQTQTTKQPEITNEQYVLQLTEKLERQLSEAETMKATLTSMQSDIADHKMLNKRLVQQKNKLQVVISDRAIKHQRQLKKMLITNKQIVKNLLDVAQKNYELESEIEQLKSDTGIILNVDDTAKDSDLLNLEEVGDNSNPSTKPRRTTQQGGDLEKIVEDSDEECNTSFKVVSKVKLLLSEMQGMFQEEDDRSHSSEILDSIDRLEKLMSSGKHGKHPHKSQQSTFTKRQPFIDNEISGSSDDNKKFDNNKLTSSIGYQIEEKEKLARLNDAQAVYESRLQEALKDSQLANDDNLTTIVLTFLKKLYQYPNIDQLIHEVEKLFAELKQYESHVSNKVKSLESAVSTYFEKASAFLHMTKSDESVPSNIPLVSDFKYFPTEDLSIENKQIEEKKQIQRPNLLAKIEENRQQWVMEDQLLDNSQEQIEKFVTLIQEQLLDKQLEKQPEKQPEEKSVDKNPLSVKSKDKSSEKSTPKSAIKTPKKVEASDKKKQSAVDNASKISQSSSRSMNSQKIPIQRSIVKKHSDLPLHTEVERGQQNVKETMSLKSASSSQLGSPKGGVYSTAKKEQDQKTKPKTVVNNSTPSKRFTKK